MPPNPPSITGLLDPGDDFVASSPLSSPLPKATKIRCAILGCGMMGQEHCSYIAGFPAQLRIDFLCDPHQPSLDKCLQVLRDFSPKNNSSATTAEEEDLAHHHPHKPELLHSEQELFQRVHDIDLLVIATPNYLHTDALLRWGRDHPHLTILVEKPVAVNREQLHRLRRAVVDGDSFRARVWVAMEYRFIPAVAKLLELIASGDAVGDIRMVTIRENRYPFLHKIGGWNRDPRQTGDTLVEKCCHFFDLMRLITQQEACLPQVRALAQRGINYQDEVPTNAAECGEPPIIDAAYVTLPFQSASATSAKQPTSTLACLELCMYAEGSRHQEEIIVTGTRGRLEAYLPENKVYAYKRPDRTAWSNRHEPPPPLAPTIYDCSNVRDVFHLSGSGDATSELPPTHGGYHYSSTAMEWYRLLEAMRAHDATGQWTPLVSLEDGICAVEIGLQATRAIVNNTAPTGTADTTTSSSRSTSSTEYENTALPLQSKLTIAAVTPKQITQERPVLDVIPVDVTEIRPTIDSGLTA